jgi:serine/threonine protein kinase
MSLVPYQPDSSRAIVLRHGSAVVVFDKRSKQLSLSDASQSNALSPANCPYCHRPLHEDALNEEAERIQHGYVQPGYFQMLQSMPASAEPSQPPSPNKRIGESEANSMRGFVPPENSPGPLMSDNPPHSSSQSIASSSFNQGFFNRFFKEIRVLGKGGQGVVLLVNHSINGIDLGNFACKRVPVGDNDGWLRKVLAEVQVLHKLSHQNLVTFHNVWLEDWQITRFGPKIPCAFILQQYCNGGDLHNYVLESVLSANQPTKEELKDRMRRKSKGQTEKPSSLASGPRRMSLDEIAAFFLDITSGLNHLHANGYVHRDLKPSNCLLHRTEEGTRVLVSDFGEAQGVDMVRKSTGATGTLAYCAPEVLQVDPSTGAFGNFTYKSDIFSLGMIVHFMCFGKLPYKNSDSVEEENEDMDQLRAEITEWHGFDDRAKLRHDLPEKLYKFLRRLLSVDPEQRPVTEDILLAIQSEDISETIGTGSSTASKVI